MHNHRPLVAALVLLVTICLIYAPDIGHGFIKDDFQWIESSRAAAAGGPGDLLRHSNGFYRPVVAATFAFNYASSGLAPFGYGLLNLLLLVVDAALLYLLARTCDLRQSASMFAAALWAFNFHGINMAVLWISGRTSLLVTMFAVLAAIAVRRRHLVSAAGCCLLAMLSKEEAVMLPAVLIAWDWRAGRVRHAWLLLVPVMVYAVMRTQTDAMWISDAPAHYQLSTTPSVLVRNALEYLDRALTWPTVVTLTVLMFARARPVLDAAERRAVWFGAIWLAGGFAITVFLPIRSSLYAVLPSVGGVLALAAAVNAAEQTVPARIHRAYAALLFVPLLLSPVYRSRNQRWVEPALLSSSVLATLTSMSRDMAAGGRIVLVEDSPVGSRLEGAFGGLFPDAVALVVDPRLIGELRRDFPREREDLETRRVFRFDGTTVTPHRRSH